MPLVTIANEQSSTTSIRVVGGGKILPLIVGADSVCLALTVGRVRWGNQFKLKSCADCQKCANSISEWGWGSSFILEDSIANS